MIDREKLKLVLAGYKEYFPNHIKDERYKWEAIKKFQDSWNIDADNFGNMFKQATEKTFNLLKSRSSYPRDMIIKFAQKDDDAVREMFRNLFDESKDLGGRVQAFQSTSEKIKEKYNNGTWKNHYQNTNAISTYLWLRYPDKYYIYKYEVFRAVAEALSADYKLKRNGSADTMINGFAMYDEINTIIAQDLQIMYLLGRALTDSCYSDPALKTTTMDVGFYLCRFYMENKSAIDMEKLDSDALVTNLIPPLVESLLAMGGRGTRPEVHEKIYADYHDMISKLKMERSIGDSQIKKGIDFARNDLAYEKFISHAEKRGMWVLTDLGRKVQMTPKLAGKIHRKWVAINEAKRKGLSVPDIDITSYYSYRIESIDDGHSKYTKADFLNEVYMSEERYDILRILLENKMNIILQGAPGVGKTFTAKRLAYAMMGEKDDSRIEMVQFHQNYSYEDFIMGYRPDGDSFKLSYGIFYRFCKVAAEHPDKCYFFIIDEINRGNMSKIFGELLMLIEKDYRETKITLAYNGTLFSVPKNLYIIGMMNTADRSLAMIDYALRRRFSFFEIEPGFDSKGFIAYQKSLENEKFNELITQIKLLNKEIASDKSLGRGFRIGHSYFCGKEPEECTLDWMRSIVEFDILPMLSEYWFDETTKLQCWEMNLNGVFNDKR